MTAIGGGGRRGGRRRAPAEVDREDGAERVAGADHRDALDDAPRDGGGDVVGSRVVEEVAPLAEGQHQQRPRPEALAERGRFDERVLRGLGEVLGGDDDRVGAAEGIPGGRRDLVERQRAGPAPRSPAGAASPG